MHSGIADKTSQKFTWMILGFAEIFASNIIKDKARSSDSDTITLATAGPSLTVLKPKPSPSKESKALFKDKPIPATELQKMMIVQKMLINQVKNQSFLNRTFYGRGSIEPGKG